MTAFVAFAAHPFKRVVAMMKDLLTDVNLRFEDHTVSIVGVDPEKVTITSLAIESENPVAIKPVQIGVYLGSLYKFIRSVGKDDEMSLTVENDHLTVKIHGIERYSEFTFKGLTLDHEIIRPPLVDEEQALALMNTLTFQKALRELGHDTNKVSIHFDETGTISLSGGDDSGCGKVMLHPCTQGLTWAVSPRETFCDAYFIKYLDKFARGAVSKTLLLTFKKDHPLVMTYFVASIEARISFFVAPIPHEMDR